MSHCININTANVNPTMEVSGQRVKVDRIDIKDVYQRYGSESLEEFRQTCSIAIAESSGKKDTKLQFQRALVQARTKDAMGTIVSNYWLAGQGLKV